MIYFFKQLILLLRDKFTGWWLLEICNCPEAAMVFCEKVAKDIKNVPRT